MDDSVIYNKEVIEFTTVTVEYCIFLEKLDANTPLDEFTDRISKILPLLYLKAQLVPAMAEQIDYGNIDQPVTEEDYNFIEQKCASILGGQNDYLEVFVEEMAFSETPIVAHVSENLADIYLDLRNFAAVFERGIEEHMEEALFNCMEDFKENWGQCLVNVLRAIHFVKYATVENNDLETDLNYEEEEW